MININTSNNNNINNNNINNINQIDIKNQLNNNMQDNNIIINNIQNSGQNNEDNPFIRNEIEKLHSQMGLTTKIEGLYKTFFVCCNKNIRVIDNLNLGLDPNEKFGLLGLNGSGKTTTFSAIINDVSYEKGQISLFGHDNKTQFKEIRPMIGYCPQENPLFDYMKVREILTFI